jgi:phenylpropionate dioxygenase-like ring-hydroxylating dioxygenase large terminal subunit
LVVRSNREEAAATVENLGAMAMSVRDNELLTKVENGAPMGQMLRENFWFPACAGAQLVADGAPLRVRLIGEQFVAFRATDGRVGFFNEACPHRRASLALARNEDNALRCLFHGWKYGVDGTVLEVPTEPNNRTDFCKKVPLKHYRVREAGGMVWVWLGKSEPKRFPAFEFNTLPADRVFAAGQQLECNWVQDLEGGVDSAHINWLHREVLKSVGIGLALDDGAPVYDIDTTSSGFRYAAIRKLKNGSQYIRVNQFVLPWYQFICPEKIPDGPRLCIISIPVDDTHCVHRVVRYNPYVPLEPDYLNPVGADPGNFPPYFPPGENWGQDRAAMAQGHWSGFHHVNTEDFAAAVSQGPITDRSQEYLNSGDRAVILTRKQLLDTVKEFRAGKELRLVQHASIPYPDIRPVADVMSESTEWRAIA